MTSLKTISEEPFFPWCKKGYVSKSEQARLDLINDLLDSIEKEIREFGDIWSLKATAEETDSGCPRFERINRKILSVIKEHRP